MAQCFKCQFKHGADPGTKAATCLEEDDEWDDPWTSDEETDLGRHVLFNCEDDPEERPGSPSLILPPFEKKII